MKKNELKKSLKKINFKKLDKITKRDIFVFTSIVFVLAAICAGYLLLVPNKDKKIMEVSNKIEEYFATKNALSDNYIGNYKTNDYVVVLLKENTDEAKEEFKDKVIDSSYIEFEQFNTDPIVFQHENTVNEVHYKVETNTNNYDALNKGYYVDGNKYTISMGKCNTGGYGLDIINVIVDEKKNVEVILSERTPEIGSTTTQAITYPKAQITIDGDVNSVIFRTAKGTAYKKITNK